MLTLGAKKLKDYIEINGLSQAKAAKLTGLSAPFISQLVSGNRRIEKVELAFKVQDAGIGIDARDWITPCE